MGYSLGKASQWSKGNKKKETKFPASAVDSSTLRAVYFYTPISKAICRSMTSHKIKIGIIHKIGILWICVQLFLFTYLLTTESNILRHIVWTK